MSISKAILFESLGVRNKKYPSIYIKNGSPSEKKQKQKQTSETKPENTTHLYPKLAKAPIELLKTSPVPG